MTEDSRAKAEKLRRQHLETDPDEAGALQIPISEAGLSARTLGILKDINCSTISDLIDLMSFNLLERNKIWSMKNTAGKGTRQEIANICIFYAPVSAYMQINGEKRFRRLHNCCVNRSPAKQGYDIPIGPILDETGTSGRTKTKFSERGVTNLGQFLDAVASWTFSIYFPKDPHGMAEMLRYSENYLRKDTKP